MFINIKVKRGGFQTNVGPRLSNRDKYHLLTPLTVITYHKKQCSIGKLIGIKKTLFLWTQLTH